MIIGDGVVDSVIPCVPIYPFQRWDVFPFMIAYALLFLFSLHETSFQYTLYIIPSVLLLQLTLFLISQWSLLFKLRLGYKVENDFSKASVVFVKAAKNAGKDRVEILYKRVKKMKGDLTVAGITFDFPLLYFQFQNIIYGYSTHKKTFVKELYPNSGHIEDFLHHRGHQQLDILVDSYQKWGENTFEIPIPLFLDLYMEHITAPFFVFQVLCLFLWSLDDYWYYSFFTLLMLMVFEGMLCRQRQSSLLMLRNMRRPPIMMNVYRLNKWDLVSSEEIVPGDLISLVSTSKTGHNSGVRRKLSSVTPQESHESQDDMIIPCDALLIRGNCVVNEAMLTGESVPQIKETLANADVISMTGNNNNNAIQPATITIDDPTNHTKAKIKPINAIISNMTKTPFNMNFDNNNDTSWRRHVVMGGTNLLQHSSMSQEEDDTATTITTTSSSSGNTGSSSSSSGKKGSINASDIDIDKSDGKQLNTVEPPPDGGCMAIVIRTGFATVQGGLMRKILFATERIRTDDYETFYFIFALVIFAVLASSIVLYHGLNDSNRNQFKLILHCIMIVTSVVPPELPMELSLAITSSLTSLSKCLVYCTEPFRLPYAGKLDILCFDKTGTLTKDKMYLKGIIISTQLQNKSLLKILNGTTTTLSSNVSSNTTLSNTEASVTIENLKKKQVPATAAATTVANVVTTSATTGTAAASNMIQSSTSSTHSSSSELSNTMNTTTTTTSNMSLEPIHPASTFSDIVTAAMASCHSLVLKNATNIHSYIGDPLEMATLETTGYQFDIGYDSRTKKPISMILPVLVSPDRSIRVALRHRFPFNSTLKRMSVVVETTLTNSTHSNHTGLFLFTKGAPEILADLMIDLPLDYHRIYLHHMSRGKRVLALAYKKLPLTILTSTNESKVLKSRQIMESQLHFMGFLIFDCDLKPDSKSVIKELKESKHKLIMITGDSPYTASDVANRLGMTSANKPTMILQVRIKKDDKTLKETNEVIWQRSEDVQSDLTTNTFSTSSSNNLSSLSTTDTKNNILFDLSQVKELCQNYNLCITGPGLAQLVKQYHMTQLSTITGNINIYARVSPAQKEIIIRTLNESGAYTLMCGDGTNDVGALKLAHVGVSIVNDPDFENKIETNKTLKSGNSKDRVARALAELQEQEVDPTIVKLGDASIASPFTSRRTSIDAVMTVLRQGRATLVTTVEVYKILALNCLVSAYMMSALYLEGLKQGDMQMTVNGLISAGLFFFLSQAKPLQRISEKRPSSSVFSFAVIFSIIGQFLVHFISLYTTIQLSKNYSKTYLSHHTIIEGKFQPDLINSAVYILCTMMQINNFVINYRGHPFTQSIQDNQLLWRSVQIIYLVILIVTGGQLEPLNHFLQLAPFPSSQFQIYLLLILLFNFGGAYLVEKISLYYE